MEFYIDTLKCFTRFAQECSDSITYADEAVVYK